MKVLEVPTSIRNKDQLIEHFAIHVPFPEFYSLNWDSFDACLTEMLENDAFVLHIEHLGWCDAQYSSLHPYRKILLEADLANSNLTVKF